MVTHPLIVFLPISPENTLLHPAISELRCGVKETDPWSEQPRTDGKPNTYCVFNISLCHLPYKAARFELRDRKTIIRCVHGKTSARLYVPNKKYIVVQPLWNPGPQ